jgi:glycosyltransferase involved in cell wall biosynthesis
MNETISQLGADDWVLSHYERGYFVDAGCCDGEHISNTYKLEKMGWSGICIDVFPKNFDRRPNSKVVEAALYGIKDLELDFTISRAPEISGITDYLGKKGTAAYTGWEPYVEKTIKVKTQLLHEILDANNAPGFIEYLSIDIEGVELEVLKTFPFDRYKFGCISLEHNYEEPRRTQIKEFLKSKGYTYIKQVKADDWFMLEKPNDENKKTFHEIWDSMNHHSFNGLDKTKIVYDELLDTFDLDGHTAEIGVYKGHTSKLIHELCKHKTHYCYDTFSGIDLSNPNIDFHKNGEYSCGLNDVKGLLGENNIVYKVGTFPNTFNEGNEKFSFVHSDTDTYAGAKATLDYFAPIMVENGKMMFDDYKSKNCKGVEKAVKEFMNDNHSFVLKEHEEQCVLIKAPAGKAKESTIELAKGKKIGLCMIVKNESKIIERCLNSVKPMIDYVSIVDTGSTDDTVDVINNWMKSNGVDGQVVFEPWKDFAYNRSFAMEKIREKKYIDYILMIDADEILMYEENVNFLEIKENLNCDLYNITCKLGSIEYARTSITKNDMPYFYKGVVHEYLECKEHIKTRETIKGIYNIPFQDSARNQNIEKYQHDAKVLQDVLKIETDPFLISRYTFYLAQSCRDSLEKEKAIHWYNERAKQGFWNQEIYISLYHIAKIKESLEYPGDDVVQSYMRAYEVCPERIEALHGAISYCRRNGRNHQAFMMVTYARSMPVNKTGLFSENWVWDYGIDDEYSIVSYWTGHIKEGIEVTENLLNKIPVSQKERVLKNMEYLKGKLNSQ